MALAGWPAPAYPVIAGYAALENLPARSTPDLPSSPGPVYLPCNTSTNGTPRAPEGGLAPTTADKVGAMSRGSMGR